MNSPSAWIRGVVLVVLLALGGCDGSGPNSPSNPANALYVCNQPDATISIIDPSMSHEVATTVDLTEHGFSDKAKPHHVVVEPDGSAWYVSLIGDNVVAKFNDKNELVDTITFESPGMLSLHPNNDLLYAGHTMSLPGVPPNIAVIQRSDMTPVQVPLSVPIDRPHGMKVSPTGDYAYASSLSANKIVAIDTETQQVQAPVSLPGPHQFYVQLDITADGQTAYITGDQGNQVQVLDLQSPAQPTLEDSVTVDGRPWHPQLSDDGSTLYFGSKATNTVTALNTATLDTTTTQGRGLANPHGSALSPDGRFLYLSNANPNGSYESSSGEDVGTVVVIDTQTRQIQTIVEVGKEPAGINTRWQP
jgi:DNA-binding beta-propeller fold protein YncE